MPFTQGELKNLTRDLNLLNESAQLLGSRLREKRLLAPNTTFYWYRQREAECIKIFTQNEASSLVYCHNIIDLTKALCVMYIAMELRLFVDLSNRSVMAVLLHNGIKFPSIPVGQSVSMKESHRNMERVLSLLNYE